MPLLTSKRSRLGQCNGLVEESAEEIPDAVKQAGRLTRFAVVTRYPGVIEPVTEEEHLEAVATVEAVVQWVEKQLGEQA